MKSTFVPQGAVRQGKLVRLVRRESLEVQTLFPGIRAMCLDVEVKIGKSERSWLQKKGKNRKEGQ